MDRMIKLDKSIPHLYVRERDTSSTYIWRCQGGKGTKIVLGRVGQIEVRAVKRMAKDMNMRASLGLPPVDMPEVRPDAPTFGEIFDRLMADPVSYTHLTLPTNREV